MIFNIADTAGKIRHFFEKRQQSRKITATGGYNVIIHGGDNMCKFGLKNRWRVGCFVLPLSTWSQKPINQLKINNLKKNTKMDGEPVKQCQSRKIVKRGAAAFWTNWKCNFIFKFNGGLVNSKGNYNNPAEMWRKHELVSKCSWEKRVFTLAGCLKWKAWFNNSINALVQFKITVKKGWEPSP